MADAMNTHEHGPATPPTDVEAERQRLIDDATEHGVDVEGALELAERVSRLSSPAEAYRAVDRRLATGSTLTEAAVTLLGEEPSPTDGRAVAEHERAEDHSASDDLRASAQRPL